jgi:HSP20 family protein
MKMMNLVKWNPWREMPALPGRLDRFFDDPFFRIGRLADESALGMWNPVVDLYEKEDHYMIKAELPGVEKDAIKIDLKDRLLTLSGERTNENEVKEENYYRRERSYGKFRRAFSLPADVDADKIKAEFKDGVLQIEVPKPEEKKAKKVTIH